MQKKTQLVLVGGGHVHALVLHQWDKRLPPNTDVTLVSADRLTPYSGMLPGVVAGHYGPDDMHIDLAKLCARVGVRFVEAKLCGVELESKNIRLDSGPSLAFDLLSLNTGSTPDQSTPGASSFVTPVKPVSTFYARWTKLLGGMQNDARLKTVGVVGGGAAGFEIACALRHRLNDKHRHIVHWVIRGKHPLSSRPAKRGQHLIKVARQMGIVVHMDFDVREVRQRELCSRDERTLALDEIIWCTGSVGPRWLETTAFKCDSGGFMETNAFLQSVSHPFVFASGDLGTQVKSPSPKAGVFAVRQAPVLAANLTRHIEGKELVPYRPQANFLSILATGGQHAIAHRGRWSVEGKWVWWLKDRIDRKFMNQFL